MKDASCICWKEPGTHSCPVCSHLNNNRLLKRKRLTQCPHCGSKRYTWVQKRSEINRKASCLVCGRIFGKRDFRRTDSKWVGIILDSNDKVIWVGRPSCDEQSCRKRTSKRGEDIAQRTLRATFYLVVPSECRVMYLAKMKANQNDQRIFRRQRLRRG